ncbi:MAG: hypothetical protein II885_17265 [Oscillospiraceae bacterium]|nr:hypothetical protein [Oscillospiraceae bacterium]
MSTVTDRPYPEKKAQQGPVGACGFEAVIPLSLLFMHPAALMRISGFEIFYDDSPSAVICGVGFTCFNT